MKILIISHVYLLKNNREKIEAIADIPGVEVHIIVPAKWNDYIRKIDGVEPGGRRNFKIYPIKTLFSRKESTYFYRSCRLKLNQIKPDIILVEHGSRALSYLQTILYKNIFCRKAKIGFFTWMNIPFKSHPIFSMIEKFNLKGSDYAITGNTEAKKLLQKKGVSFPIEVIAQLGVNENNFKKKNQKKMKKNLGLKGFVIGFVGRFDKEKGIGTLIKAGSKLKKYSILMVGTGNDREYFTEMAKEMGVLKNIVFHDVVPMQELAEFYNCMDVLVLPSLTTPTWKEQFGHTLIEAMSCNVPVIGSDSGEIPKVIDGAGFIFKEGCSTDLKKYIEILMKNPKTREKFSKLGRERVIKNYTHKKIARKTINFFQRIK